MKVFISYRSTDSARVDSIVSQLSSVKGDGDGKKYTVWQDKTSINPAKDWWREIVDGIIDCQVFVFMVSNDSVKSDVCRAELNYARRRNRPIIPVVLPGEFTFNSVTGKHDIDFWPDVPDELGNIRAQFLFYDGVRAFQRLEETIEQMIALKKRDLPAPIPNEPVPYSEDVPDNADIYNEAVDFANRMGMLKAEELFMRLIDQGAELFVDDAYEWIETLRAYEEITRLDEHEATRHKIPEVWADYSQKYPKKLPELYDPKDYATLVMTISISRPAPAARPEPEPEPETTTDPISQSIQLPGMRDLVSSTALLPTPFDWIEIPAGTVTIEGRKFSYFIEDTHVAVRDFEIAKYPITNAQYRAFIDDGGYNNSTYWTDAGWERREEKEWTLPAYWLDAEWNGDDYPVVGVSWFEAIAFCQWLQQKTGENIMLPTEAQWQRAAQGNGNRAYPWGNSWSPTRGNSEEVGIKQSTPVRHFEGKGDSPFGVVDMSGNVFDWCLNEFQTGKIDIESGSAMRVRRGGSFERHKLYSRTDYRFYDYPHYRRTELGFRIVRLHDE